MLDYVLHLLTFASATLVATLVAYYLGARRAHRAHRRIEDTLAERVPAPGRRSVFVHGQGVICPVCGTPQPFYNLMPMPEGRQGFADHVIHEHPESDLASDVRYLRAHNWRTQSYS